MCKLSPRIGIELGLAHSAAQNREAGEAIQQATNQIRHHLHLSVLMTSILMTSFYLHTHLNLSVHYALEFSIPLKAGYTTVEKASGRSRMLGQDMVI